MTRWQPKFTETSTDQPIHEIVSPLILVDKEGEVLVSGTGFVIGPRLGLTACHVIEDFLKRHGLTLESIRNSAVPFEIRLFLSIDEGKRQIPIKVLGIWRAIPLDISVFHFGIPIDFPADHPWKYPRLQLLPPRVGDNIAAFGFANSSVSRQAETNIPIAHLKPYTSTGTVEEIHRCKRDSVRMPFPCFQTNARFDASMSGGPVLLESGSVCGVISSGFEFAEAGGEHISYASSLWPVVATVLNANREGFAPGSEYPLLDLFRSGLICATDWEQVYLHQRQDGSLQVRAKRVLGA